MSPRTTDRICLVEGGYARPDLPRPMRPPVDERRVRSGMALPPGGLQIEDVESGGEAVSRLDRDPVGCTVKRHCDSERATLIRVDGEPDRVSGEPEPVGVDRRMAALDW